MYESLGVFLSSSVISFVWLTVWTRGTSRLAQPIRDLGMDHHIQKKGTPTMGGIGILLSILLSVGVIAPVDWDLSLAILGPVLGFALIGLWDDYLKLKKRHHAGLSGRIRILLQSILAYASLMHLGFLEALPTVWSTWGGGVSWPFGVGILWGIFVIVGSANAVNLTDGLDGLAIGCVLIASLGLMVISQQPETYFLILALWGGGLSFLWWNACPARVFMGDVGSLPIGALLGMIALREGVEYAWAVMGLVFVLETLSVMIQVLSFKRTGRRIFLMAPLHHHFEKAGWPETQIVTRAWIVTALMVGLIICMF